MTLVVFPCRQNLLPDPFPWLDVMGRIREAGETSGFWPKEERIARYTVPGTPVAPTTLEAFPLTGRGPEQLHHDERNPSSNSRSASACLLICMFSGTPKALRNRATPGDNLTYIRFSSIGRISPLARLMPNHLSVEAATKGSSGLSHKLRKSGDRNPSIHPHLPTSHASHPTCRSLVCPTTSVTSTTTKKHQPRRWWRALSRNSSTTPFRRCTR